MSAPLATDRRRIPIRRLLTVTGLLGIIGMVGFFGFWHCNHTIVRNVSLRPVTDVVLELRDINPNSEWKKMKRMARLEPGGTLSLKHWNNDTRAAVEFTIDGRRVRHDDGEYIDLWMGETWALDIQPDASIIAGYFAEGRRYTGD